jgi:hypothetical protein
LTGALAFLFYLTGQLGLAIEDVIANGAADLAQVYNTITGNNINPVDPALIFATFRHQLDIIYPATATITRPNSDNPYPIGKVTG